MGRGNNTDSLQISTQQAVVRDKVSQPSSQLSIEEKIKAIDDTPPVSGFQASYFEGSDGTFIPGIEYRTDYKYEEEAGIGDLRKAITSENPRRFQMTDDARQNIAIFRDKNAIAISIRPLADQNPAWGDELFGASDNYANSISKRLNWTQGLQFDEWKFSVAELREKAKSLGVKPLPSKKADLIAAISEALVRSDENRDRPEAFPGEFNYGTTMILSAEGNGATAEMVSRVRQAAEEGYLGIGNASGPFSSGVLFYDTRDETEAIRENREKEFDLYDQRMEALAPVAEEVKEKGWGVYFLGKPSEITVDGKTEIRYWLNGTGINHKTNERIEQPSGYYTLEELRNEKFVADAKQAAAKRDAEKAAGIGSR
jgi:hypothetical protein